MKIVKIVLPSLLLSLLLLQGCGFHLRGAVILPDEMAATWVDGSGVSTELVRAVQDGVRRTNGGVVSRESAATSVLKLSGEEFSRRVATVDGSTGKVSEYQLSYRVTWQLRSIAGALVKQGELKQSENYKYSGTEVLGKEQEEEHLRKVMIREAVRDLLRALRSR